MKQLIYTIIVWSLSFSLIAKTIVLKDEEAKQLYQHNKENSFVISQKEKKFIVHSPSGKVMESPRYIVVKKNEGIFIVNDEEDIVHNVYDEDDQSWVLTKQKASSVALVKFTTKGIHNLRCAIHPKMKIRILVE